MLFYTFGEECYIKCYIEKHELMPKISISYVIYEKQRQKDGSYPIKLRFTYNRKPALFRTTLFAKEEDLVKPKKGEENKSRTIKSVYLRRKAVQ